MAETTTGTWASVKPDRVSNQIVEQVTRELLAGRLHPGDHLGSEADLAAQFGVSRTTVRSAVRTLETLGAVSVQVGANGGVRVSHGDVMRFADVLAIQLQLVGIDRDEMKDTQLALETHAAERAATQRTEEDLVLLRQLLDDARREQDDPDAVADLHVRFHSAIMTSQSNSTLAAVHRSLTAAMAVRFRAGATAENVERVAREHEAVFEAIAAGDALRARTLMVDHLCHKDIPGLDS